MIENFNEDGIIAFATVQGALEAVAKGRSVANKRGGTMYKYANIADVIAAVRQPLTENGFVFTHTTVPVSGPDGSPLPDLVRMRCVIIHRTGMTVTSEATSHVQNIDPQGIGSALTYLRRYTLLGALGLETEDDDAISQRRPREQPQPQREPQRQAPPQREQPAPQREQPAPQRQQPAPQRQQQSDDGRQGLLVRLTTRMRQFRVADAEILGLSTMLLGGVGPRDSDVGTLEALVEELEACDEREFDKLCREAQPAEGGDA